MRKIALSIVATALVSTAALAQASEERIHGEGKTRATACADAKANARAFVAENGYKMISMEEMEGYARPNGRGEARKWRCGFKVIYDTQRPALNGVR